MTVPNNRVAFTLVLEALLAGNLLTSNSRLQLLAMTVYPQALLAHWPQLSLSYNRRSVGQSVLE
jgi:hypothetical protein